MPRNATLCPLAALAVLWPACALAAGAAGDCTAHSAARMPTLVELYTSEGCSSCPPADRWLSALKGQPDTIALAFHVDYWDRLGWPDRFASSAYSERQAWQRSSNGARFSYTPQVVVDGRDKPNWNTTPLPVSAQQPPTTVQLTLQREGRGYSAIVLPSEGAPKRLAAFWALTENNHQTVVKAGENDGATLHHDFVVREYLPVAVWNVKPGESAALRFSSTQPTDSAHPRAVNLVVLDADTGRPVQALKLACAAADGTALDSHGAARHGAGLAANHP